MYVYLDNNIIVSLEDGEISFESIKSLIPDATPKFFYSSAHIFEVEHFEGSHAIAKEHLLSKRFASIRSIFKNNYLYLDFKEDNLTHIMADPEDVYSTITDVPFGIHAMKTFMNLFSKRETEE